MPHGCVVVDEGAGEADALGVLADLGASGGVVRGVVRDGEGVALAILCGPGRGGDLPMLAPLLNGLSVAHEGPGRPRTRPDMLPDHKA